MPIHDWTRATDAAYHAFQLGWATGLTARLNDGLLPRPLYAMTETVDLHPGARFCELPEPDRPAPVRNWEDELPDAPPRTRLRFADDRRQYDCRVVTVRDGLHQPLGAVLWVTRQDKETPYRLDGLVRLAVGATACCVHLLVVDLFPPSKRDPRGVHRLIWDRIKDEPFEPPPDKPLTLAAYSSGSAVTAYVEPVAVGDVLPAMPLFLTPDRYVRCPLEATYQQSWAALPRTLRAPLEARPG